MRRVLLLTLLALVASTPSAFAQSAPRAYITVGASAQLTTNDTTTSETFPLFAETARVTGTVTAPKAVRFDVGAGVRVAGPLRVGVLFSGYTHDGAATATFTLPDPFLFNTPHTATGSAPVSRRELDVHIQLSAPIVERNGWQVILAGGPTIAQLQQPLLTQAVTHAFAFPFDTITTAPGTSTSSGHGLGGHVQLSVVRAVGQKIGVYGDLLFSSAKATVTGDAGSQKLDTGGLAVGGGLRIGF